MKLTKVKNKITKIFINLDLQYIIIIRIFRRQSLLIKTLNENSFNIKAQTGRNYSFSN